MYIILFQIFLIFSFISFVIGQYHIILWLVKRVNKNDKHTRLITIICLIIILILEGILFVYNWDRSMNLP